MLITTASALISRVSEPAWTLTSCGPMKRASPLTRVTVSKLASIAWLAARSFI